jgi:hypothetical protein
MINDAARGNSGTARHDPDPTAGLSSCQFELCPLFLPAEMFSTVSFGNDLRGKDWIINDPVGDLSTRVVGWVVPAWPRPSPVRMPRNPVVYETAATARQHGFSA